MAVTPVHMQWSYCSLALGHWYFEMQVKSIIGWLVIICCAIWLYMLEMWCSVPQTAVLAIFRQIQLKAWNILLQCLYTVNVCGMINKMFQILITTENYAHVLRFVVIWCGLVEFCWYWYLFIYIGSISPKSTRSYFTGIREMISFRENFVYGPSQWEMMLQCNIVFHWLGLYKNDPWWLTACEANLKNMAKWITWMYWGLIK